MNWIKLVNKTTLDINNKSFGGTVFFNRNSVKTDKCNGWNENWDFCSKLKCYIDYYVLLNPIIELSRYLNQDFHNRPNTASNAGYNKLNNIIIYRKHMGRMPSGHKLAEE